MKSIILASQSPRRKELLHRLLDSFLVECDTEEEVKIPGEAPMEMVQRLAMDKVRHVAARTEEDALIIGADTVVASEGVCLGKPKDKEEAFKMLSALSGREHQVFTGIAVLDTESGKAMGDVSMTRVRFRRLTPAEIEDYIASGEPMDKAGGYGIQDLGALLVEGIEGDYFTVVGLPICRLGKLLKEEFSLDLLKQKK